MTLHLVAALGTLAVGQVSELDKLRADLSQRYVEPEPHMALARHYHDKGNRLQAFLLLEYARRNLVARPQFDAVFERTFLQREPFDNSKAAEAALSRKHAQNPKHLETTVELAKIAISRNDWPKAKEWLGKALQLRADDFDNVMALAEVYRREGKSKEAAKLVDDFMAAHPKSIGAYESRIGPLMREDPAAAKRLLAEAIKQFPRHGNFVFNLGVLHQDEGDLKGAEERFVAATKLAKDSAHIQGWAGRFFVRVKKDDEQALHHYLNAYFLDPHFYDSEFAERRIGLLAIGIAQARYATLVAERKVLDEIAGDDNPMVAGIAIDEIGKKWDTKYLKAALAALGHDDEYVRAKALRALLQNVDRSFDDQLKALLQDPDTRKKGMAAYLAVKLWNQAGVETVQPWLKLDNQLLRYDALSALLRHGGDKGKQIVHDHREREQHPWFGRWLESFDKPR